MRDVIVAGAGPAGACTAAALAQRGFDVLLCDRARFPRDTLCGEFLSPESGATLERLGVAGAIDALKPSVIDRMRIVSPDGRAVERELRPAARGVTRHGLDACLLSRARDIGAEVWLGCRVTGCVPGDDFAVSMLVDGRKRSERAHAVVDATGHARWLARAGSRAGATERPRPGRTPFGRDGFVGVKRHFRSRWPRAADEAERTLVLAPVEGGYVGRAPVEGGVFNVCLLGRASDLREAGGRPEAMLASLAAQYPGVAWLLESLAPIGGFTTTAGLMLGVAPRGPAMPVGDAAGMIAPLAGDGIAMALRSSELASEALSRYLQGACGWEEAQARYRREWRREFLGRMRVAAGLQRLVTRSGAADRMVSFLTRWPRAIDLLVRGTRGRVPADLPQGR